MRKFLFILIALLFVVGCSDDSNDEVEAEVIEDVETEQEEFDIEEAEKEAREEAYKQSEDTEKELYILMINELFLDYEEEYEAFTLESGSSFYDLVISDITQNGIDAATDNTEKLLEVLTAEQQEAFGLFLGELLEIEEMFSHLEWE